MMGKTAKELLARRADGVCFEIKAVARPFLHAAMLELLFEPSEILAQRHQEVTSRAFIKTI